MPVARTWWVSCFALSVGLLCQPAAVADVLLTARYLRTAHRIEPHIDGKHAAIGGLPPVTIAEYGLDELILEQYAEDLATSGNPQLVGRKLTFSTQVVFSVSWPAAGHQVLAEWRPGGDGPVGSGCWIDELAG